MLQLKNWGEGNCVQIYQLHVGIIIGCSYPTNVLFDSLLCEILTQQEILFVGYYPTSYDVHF